MMNQRGSASLELTLMTPVLLVFLLLVVAGGRLTVARSDLNASAREGARVASLARTPQQAQIAAEAAIAASLAARQLSCRSPVYTVDAGELRPGGTVTASVRCEVSFADLTLLPLPASKTMTARFTEVVDTYRQVS